MPLNRGELVLLARALKSEFVCHAGSSAPTPRASAAPSFTSTNRCVAHRGIALADERIGMACSACSAREVGHDWLLLSSPARPVAA